MILSFNLHRKNNRLIINNINDKINHYRLSCCINCATDFYLYIFLRASISSKVIAAPLNFVAYNAASNACLFSIPKSPFL